MTKAAKPTSYRFDAETMALIKKLGERLCLRDVDVLRQAVRRLAAREGVK